MSGNLPKDRAQKKEISLQSGFGNRRSENEQNDLDSERGKAANT